MKIALSVVDFALPSPMVGSIESGSGLTGLETGIEIHQKLQAKRVSESTNYEPEVFISFEISHQGYDFKITGRMDGIFQDEPMQIEEIKSSFDLPALQRALETNLEHPYRLQLQSYGYFHYKKTGHIPKLTLHLVSARTGASADMPVALDVPAYEAWLNSRLDDLIVQIKLAQKTIQRRKKAALSLEFPFETKREGQTELISQVETAFENGQTLLAQAPTGLGKTMGVLYPALKNALSQGQKVVYLTPKNSQHVLAEEAATLLSTSKSPIKTLTLTAKQKLCLKDEPICNPSYCEFAKDHFTKVAQNNLPGLLIKKRKWRAKSLRVLGQDHQVCPVELQYEAAKHADVVIADYNYVFSPNSGGRISLNNISERGKPNLIIDEIHNLPQRGMDYYSPSLEVHTFEQLAARLESVPEALKPQAHALLGQCVHLVAHCPDEELSRAFLAHDEAIREFLGTYLASDVALSASDPILQMSFYWSEFTSVLALIEQDAPEFFITRDKSPAAIHITCCDAGKMIKPKYLDFKHVVGFSATLKPFEFYARLTGLEGAKLTTTELASPFPKSNRKILLIPQISTKYTDRAQNYGRIAETIERISSVKQGNYFAFFPSFDFLEQVFTRMKASDGFELVRQSKGMNKSQIDDLMENLRDDNKAHIVFAVQGGILSEGVDYPGNMAIGAFIIGPPLPNCNKQQEGKKAYYQKHYDAGFDYAYVYPAMAKAIQAAGRVIRSPTDRGVIVLMDNRFLQPSYAECMPESWFEKSATELVSSSILHDVSIHHRG
ncbi:MAG: ATP-dependent DNA helicase [Myxococcota bacterium]